MTEESSHKTPNIDHLFRQESGKMTAVLTKLLGFEKLEVAEDIVQDTFIQAFENWKFNGVPDNPQGWLYTVAKNKATDYLRREQVKRRVDTNLKTAIPVEYTITAHLEKAFYEIKDNQLQMLFAVCHPAIPMDAQVALALKTLGGFSAAEIARAFLTNEEVINKRLYRAKDKIRKAGIKLEIPSGKNLEPRIASVLKTIYLLYNEGYHSSSTETVIRKDLCLEAMRLGLLLHEAQLPDNRDICALLALMCLHTSRFESRINDLGDLIPMARQDRSRWNQELIQRGIGYMQYLDIDAMESTYQLEAAIAYLHTLPDIDEKWSGMLALFDKLLNLKKDPVTYLNFAFVLNKARGAQEAIEFLARAESLRENYLYQALMGELHKPVDSGQAFTFFQAALTNAPLEAEKKIIQQKLDELESG